MENYLQLYKDILKQVKDEVKKLTTKQEDLLNAEQNIITIKDNTSQILNILKEIYEQPIIKKNIQSLNKVMEIEQKTYISSVIELNDLRIATGDYGGKISIYSIDYEKEQWKINTELKGHNGYISSLYELNGNKLISGSFDKTIKVWKINNNTLTLTNTLDGHNESVYQVISLSNNVIASGSNDYTIRIWDINSNKEIHSLKEDFIVFSLLKLKNKNVLASSGKGEKITFWNTNTFAKEHSVGCCNCSSSNGLIELPNHYIAVSGGLSTSIDIIDTDNYQLFKQIECNDYIISSGVYYSSLHLLNNETFIYSHNGCFCQVSTNEYEIVFKVKMEDEFEGATVISSSNDKYVVASNNKKGVSIFKIKFI